MSGPELSSVRPPLDPARHETSHGELVEEEGPELRPLLASWRKNVGAPVIFRAGSPLRTRPTRIDVLCWNLGIGRGRLDVVVDAIRNAVVRETPAGSEEPPLVLLVQEAYRADATVPELHFGPFHGGVVRAAADTMDIVEFARAHELSLCYAPSMRNGSARSDRGNAVLATRPLGRSYTFSLPFIRQRRVAVASELVGLPVLGFVSAHFENRGRLVHGPRAMVGLGATRAVQAEALGKRILATEGGDVVLGADLNTARGPRDPAYQSLLRAGFRPARRIGLWNHTYHGILRLPLDHVLYHSHAGQIEHVEVQRLDQDPHDRGRRIFGSDHHPLLARVHLTASAPADPSYAPHR